MTPDFPSSLIDDVSFVLQVTAVCAVFAFGGAIDFKVTQRKQRAVLEWFGGAAIIGIGLSQSLSRPQAFVGLLIVAVIYVIAVFVLWKQD